MCAPPAPTPAAAVLWYPLSLDGETMSFFSDRERGTRSGLGVKTPPGTADDGQGRMRASQGLPALQR